MLRIVLTLQRDKQTLEADERWSLQLPKAQVERKRHSSLRAADIVDGSFYRACKH